MEIISVSMDHVDHNDIEILIKITMFTMAETSKPKFMDIYLVWHSPVLQLNKLQQKAVRIKWTIEDWSFIRKAKLSISVIPAIPSIPTKLTAKWFQSSILHKTSNTAIQALQAYKVRRKAINGPAESEFDFKVSFQPIFSR